MENIEIAMAERRGRKWMVLKIWFLNKVMFDRQENVKYYICVKWGYLSIKGVKCGWKSV